MQCDFRVIADKAYQCQTCGLTIRLRAPSQNIRANCPGPRPRRLLPVRVHLAPPRKPSLRNPWQIATFMAAHCRGCRFYTAAETCDACECGAPVREKLQKKAWKCPIGRSVGV